MYVRNPSFAFSIFYFYFVNLIIPNFFLKSPDNCYQGIKPRLDKEVSDTYSNKEVSIGNLFRIKLILLMVENPCFEYKCDHCISPYDIWFNVDIT